MVDRNDPVCLGQALRVMAMIRVVGVEREGVSRATRGLSLDAELGSEVHAMPSPRREGRWSPGQGHVPCVTHTPRVGLSPGVGMLTLCAACKLGV